MGQFTIKNVPFIHARYGREITCTFGGTEMPEMTPPPHVNQRCTMTPMEIKRIGRLYDEDYDGPLLLLTKEDIERISKPCIATPVENKMDEVKTETHLGKVYQIDQEYLFSNDGTHLVYGRLKAICPKSSYPFEAHDGFLCKYIGLIQDCKDQGTITPAPIEYIDNAPYIFEVGGSQHLGFYEKSQKAFFDRDDGGDEVAKLSDCTNIRLMTVESK
jgi:hypothetical protein